MASSTHPSQSNLEQKPSITSLQPFTRTTQLGGRVVREYAGVLPCTKQSARHILRCEHLRDIPGEPISFYKVEESYTHQLWIWYREVANPDHLKLLFRSQFDFSVAGIPPDSAAVAITDALAEILWECQDVNQVFHNGNSEALWEGMIETQITKLIHAQARATLHQEA